MVPQKTLEKHFSDVNLEMSTIEYVIHIRGALQGFGEASVQLQLGRLKVKLLIMVVFWKGPTLFGRIWLHFVKLNWSCIHLYSMFALGANGNTCSRKGSKHLKACKAIYKASSKTIKAVMKIFNPHSVLYA